VLVLLPLLHCWPGENAASARSGTREEGAIVLVQVSRVDLYSLGIFELCPGSLTFFGV
jgi:hypothetical protein